MSNFYKNLPQTPGVYIMKDTQGKIMYIGKAANLRRRVSGYFLKPADSRVQKLVSKIKKINCQKTETILEALILESRLIKKHQPFFNIKEKDDKSFLYVEITKEKFPRVLLGRGKTLANSVSDSEKFGPFVSASAIREALKILRRIFTWSIHKLGDDTFKFRACFDYEIGLCPGTCVNAVSRADYLKNIRNLKLFFQGKKPLVLKNLKKEMRLASKNLKFEKAEKLRRQIFALKHIHDSSLITEKNSADFLKATSYKLKANRMESYDISNISGDFAVGSMVVFINGESAKNEYRRFKIKTVHKPDDTAMLKEILRRRFRHSRAGNSLVSGERIAKNDWSLPNLILVDGGRGQVNAAKNVLAEFGLEIPVVGIAKGPKRKNNIFVGEVSNGINKNLLLRVRDEAHRFALSYHRKLRSAAAIT